MSKETEEESAYEEGCLAYENGLSLNSNPYDEYSNPNIFWLFLKRNHKHVSWSMGWLGGEEFKRMRLALSMNLSPYEWGILHKNWK